MFVSFGVSRVRYEPSLDFGELSIPAESHIGASSFGLQ